MATMLFKSFRYKTIHTVIHTLYSVLLIPILLTYWDLKFYGAWIALFSIFNIIQVLEYGHATYIGNKFNALINSNPEEAKNVLGSALRANLLTGVFELAIVYCLFKSGLLQIILKTDINDTTITMVLAILFVYRMVIGSFKGIVVKTLNPFGLIYKSFQFATVERLLDFLILAGVAVWGLSLIKLAIVWVCVKTVFSICVLLSLKKTLPDLYPWWQYGTFKTGFLNFKKSIPFVVSNFLERLRNDGIVLIISILMGVSFLPLFVATRTIVNIGLKIGEIISIPLNPELINLYIQKKFQKIQDVFKVYWLSTASVLIIGYLISLTFIEQLFGYWTKGKLAFNLVLYSSLIVILLVQNYGKIIFTFFSSINKSKVVLTTSILRAVILLVAIITFKAYGLYGVLSAMFLSELIVNAIYLPYQSFQVFSPDLNNKIRFYLNLCTVLYIAFLLYLNVINISFWVICALSTIVFCLLYYQYVFVSLDSKNYLIKKIGMLKRFNLKRMQ